VFGLLKFSIRLNSFVFGQKVYSARGSACRDESGAGCGCPSSRRVANAGLAANPPAHLIAVHARLPLDSCRVVAPGASSSPPSSRSTRRRSSGSEFLTSVLTKHTATWRTSRLRAITKAASTGSPHSATPRRGTRPVGATGQVGLAKHLARGVEREDHDGGWGTGRPRCA
jgi:hypothetical protein